ncbi:uncharacterized protein PV09_06867 [Verruconis gallopava]|uniref:Phosphoglycerate mutase family protein n=1 Tax=Verruconis gallopava TaxID=253628 RepID=A0A0D1XHI0_9PEZI|nr:uncharacterized protein PV09_06867 [Verruconis gallopava]KIW01686.1 hypothetical protein PV09_06867 [Verruconis gallopava]
MGWFDGSSQEDAYNTVSGNDNYGQEHEPSKVHELIAGAAAYEAAKAYENHVSENGQPPSHEKAKEILAGFAGAFIDREAETKGLDFIDREKAKYDARRQAEQALADNNDQGW